MFLGGILEKKVGTRFATLIGCLITRVFLSAYTIKVSYYLFLVTYGVMFGVGIGIAYAPPMSVAMSWFPRHRGVANGFIVAGFGGGAFIFDQVQTAFLNPHNVKAVGAKELGTSQDIGDDKYFNDDSVLAQVPNMFILLGVCYATLQIVGVLLLFPVNSGAEKGRN
ncbi:hypothetical protein EB796_007979 [Bugula neritina]|uniref:Major facilitator superfamily (MFS) profile domain-containing protein n=1 Tax=Bugula neritina TaxID=10212 RepID=A0A7J7K6Y9_BUGNE|nr:hypothetical protein EB796_007979 [Bugula neritina]